MISCWWELGHQRSGAVLVVGMVARMLGCGGIEAGVERGADRCTTTQTTCGSLCCDPTEKCVSDACLARERSPSCEENQTQCGPSCCDSHTQECVDDACVAREVSPRCEENETACGSSCCGLQPKVAMGTAHTCVVTSKGGAKCWGFGEDGQLGNGSTVYQDGPAQVLGLDSGVIAIDASDHNSCAILEGGRLLCWGANDDHQLGAGVSGGQLAPVQVFGLEVGVVSVSCGIRRTCAVTSEGKTFCWGDRYSGPSPHGGPRDAPQEIDGLPFALAVSVGAGHICALTADREVFCWGENGSGALGNGSVGGGWSYVPGKVIGLDSGVVAISAGWAHTCAVTSEGGVMCWGANDKGQLGDGTTVGSGVPTRVNGLDSGVSALGSAFEFSCAVTIQGKAKCWGANYLGQLGDGTTEAASVPKQVKGLESGAVSVAGGWVRACAVTSLGELMCWGLAARNSPLYAPPGPVSLASPVPGIE